MPTLTISRTSPLPLHYQLREVLRAGINGGAWRPGQRIPAESELCTRYRVSRITVRQAVAALVAEGLLYRARGRGTFVAAPRVSHVVSVLVSFTVEMAQRGLTTTSRILESGTVPAGERIRDALQVSPSEAVVAIRRLRFADGEPLALQTVYLPGSRFGGIDASRLATESLYRILEQEYGIQIVRAQEVYRPIVLRRVIAAALRASTRTAAFEVERTTFDSDNRPVEFVTSILRGDRMQLTLELIRKAARL